jgi:hypothetical protein
MPWQYDLTKKKLMDALKFRDLIKTIISGYPKQTGVGDGEVEKNPVVRGKHHGVLFVYNK